MILHKTTTLDDRDNLLHSYDTLPKAMQDMVYENSFNSYKALITYFRGLQEIQRSQLKRGYSDVNETLEEIAIVKRDISELSGRLLEITENLCS